MPSSPHIALQSLISLALLWWIFWLFVENWQENGVEAVRTAEDVSRAVPQPQDG